MPTGNDRKAKPQVKVGDIVFADLTWMMVRDKEGQNIVGLGVTTNTVYRTKSSRVERVFRELGRRA